MDKKEIAKQEDMDINQPIKFNVRYWNEMLISENEAYMLVTIKKDMNISRGNFFRLLEYIGRTMKHDIIEISHFSFINCSDDGFGITLKNNDNKRKHLVEISKMGFKCEIVEIHILSAIVPPADVYTYPF